MYRQHNAKHHGSKAKGMFLWASIIASKMENKNIQLKFLVRYPGRKTGQLLVLIAGYSVYSWHCPFCNCALKMHNTLIQQLPCTEKWLRRTLFPWIIYSCTWKWNLHCFKTTKASARPKYLQVQGQNTWKHPQKVWEVCHWNERFEDRHQRAKPVL